MPTFSHKLPSSNSGNGYDLRRTPPDRPLLAVVTSEDFFVCETHYWGGKTVPCEGEACKACEANSPTRPHVYLSAIEFKTHDHFLYECTATAAIPLDVYRRANRTLRGCQMKSWRPKRIKNGRIEMLCKPIDLATLHLPPAPNIPKALCVIWQIPFTSMMVDACPGANPAIKPNPEVFDRMHGRDHNDPLPDPTPIADILAESTEKTADGNGQPQKLKLHKPSK